MIVNHLYFSLKYFFFFQQLICVYPYVRMEEYATTSGQATTAHAMLSGKGIIVNKVSQIIIFCKIIFYNIFHLYVFIAMLFSLLAIDLCLSPHVRIEEFAITFIQLITVHVVQAGKAIIVNKVSQIIIFCNIMIVYFFICCLNIHCFTIFQLWICLSSPCENGGVCNNFQTGYNCTCSAGWEGTHCELGKSMLFFALIYNLKIVYSLYVVRLNISG